MPRPHTAFRARSLTAMVTPLVCGLLTAFAQQPITPATSPAATVTATGTTAPASSPAQGGTIRGRVVANTPGKGAPVPLPGVSVTATNTLTGRKFSAATDIDGRYEMTIARNGRYVVRAELTGFALLTQEVVLNGADAQAATQAAAQGITIPLKSTDFGLELASRAAAQATQSASARSGNGTQALSLTQGDTDVTDASSGAGNSGTSLPSLANLGDSAGGSAASQDAIAVNGQAGQTNGLANFSEDEIRDRVQGAVEAARANGMLPPGVDANQITAGVMGMMMGGGGPGGPGGGGGGRGGRGGGGGGSFRNFNPAQPHGSFFYQGANSALNSAPWSPTLLPQLNPPAFQNRFGVTFASSPYIPGLTKPNTKQFVFLNFTGQKNLNQFTAVGRVPTLAERAGDFSQSALGTGSKATPVQLYNPATGQPILNNCLTATCGTAPGAGLGLSPQALALLSYYPAPNTPLNSLGDNYQTTSNGGNNNVAINARYVRTLGQATGSPFGMFGGGGRGGSGGGRNGNTPNQKPTLRQNINIAYNYSHSASDNRNIFLPLGGASATDGNGLNVGYTIGYGRLSNNASLNWNRLRSETRNYFTDTQNDPTQTAGLTVPNNTGGFADPRFYNGLPTLSISNFTPLSNTSPSETLNQTISVSDFVSWRHNKHNMRFGVDVRRVHTDSIGGNNPLGSLSFTGYATASGTDQGTGNAGQSGFSGDAFADFLLGLPQTTSIQASLYKTYLRENVYDWYAQDDWRAGRSLTINAGLRYEYFGPFSEKNGRLVNLDYNHATSPLAAASDPVQPGQIGTYGGRYSAGLVNPDNAMFAPRIGLAYRLPNKGITRQTVLRGGYGINYNTGQYAVFAKKLSGQPPFAVTQTNTLASGCTTLTPSTTANMTLAHGFGCATQESIQNNWAVDKNYRLGMVQIYNLNLQRTLGLGIVLNIGYNGSFGSNLDVVGTPNGVPTSINATGRTTPDQAPFDYEESSASSRSNQLVVSAQKRLQKGVAIGATYTYMHAIDNASGVGGAVGSPVQNLFNLAAEEGNSSFDQRHNLTGTWVYEPPFGPNRTFLNKGGVVSHIVDGWSLSGAFTFASGNYLTPVYSGNAQEAFSGNTFTQRANRIFTQPIRGPGSIGQWFNTSAFVAPIGYGTASQGSIEGPGTVSVNASASRTIPMGETRSFEGRITASNVFNTVQYSGINVTQNSFNFGQVTSAAAMRSILFQARYRF